MKKHAPTDPPAWIEKLLRFFLDDRIAESVIGDITEKFIRQTQDGRKFIPALQYIIEGLSLLRLAAFSKTIRRYRSNNSEMIANYFLVAYRNLKKERLYFIMSVAGMAVALACVMVIYAYIRFEKSYDRFHPNHENIFRITSEFNDDGERIKSARTNSACRDVIFQKIAGIDNVIRLLPLTGLVSPAIAPNRGAPDLKFRETNFCFSDSMFFSMFSFRALEGNLDHALDAPLSVVITERAAKKYFGTTNVVGRELIYEDEDNSYSYNVTGVIADFPQNGHFAADFIASFSSLLRMPFYDDGQYPPLYVYLQTNQSTTPETLAAKILPSLYLHQPEFDRLQKQEYQIQRLTDIHLRSNLQDEWQSNPQHIYIDAFAALAGFILIIGCINFINLATAQAIKRGREIGVRKVFGGLKKQLIVQFLTETLVHVLAAFVISLILAELTLRFFLAPMIGKEFTLLSLVTPSMIVIAATFILVVSFLAGIYPSVHLSQLKLSVVLKGHSLSHGGDSMRKTLATFQVVLSCLLITGTIIIVKQVNYFESHDLGFDKDQVMSISLTDRYAQKNYAVFSEKLRRETSVVSIGLSSALPGNNNFYGFDIQPEGYNKDQKVNIKTLGVDEGFVTTYNLKLLDGRDFSSSIPTDQLSAFIINEAAARKLGWKDPVGKELELVVYVAGRQVRKGKVIGLVKDFNFKSLHERIEPLLLYINKHPYYAENLSVRLKPGDLSSNVQRIKAIWKDFHPDKPLEYSFINESLDRLYQSEARFGKILSAISIIVISISALGIFSLSSYMASRRAKELSLRKVFGATGLGLFILQYRQYFILVLVANIITIPLCVYGARQWLNTLPYHISLDAGIFITTFLGSIIGTLIIISFHTYRVSSANPAAVIRNE